MKILCLHGYGTNADVLRYQMRRLRESCDPSWEFHYLSGEEPCSPAPGTTDNFPAPFLCYTSRFDPEGQAAAHALIDEAIAEHGPFDGAFCFSQGASVMVSFLLESVRADPDLRPPLKFLILCSPTIPLAESPDYCHTVLGSLSDADQAHLRSGQDEQIKLLPEPAQLLTTSLISVVDAVKPITGQPRSFFLDRPLNEIPCALHPDLCPARLSLPVLYTRGKDDLNGMPEWVSLVQGFITSSKQRVYEHSGGHNVPQKQVEVHQMISAMEWVMAQSLLPTS
ncbi:hypothetical protein ASPZODRAFT_65538 [Penicilliopsis zonata CBS 506.65]|uniref:Serine hydrolase domain-containing protein n=1 Tax=Penicilliopsis zonata CBS 506.65 TaxID=1073090 RepID=A0A1L9SJJ3_9EURO|nr:hypothetical protein ASPZODRAFT_65538 [Penicilliopsis zonata CBS 506.65]OJJ47402.1 hypothetical protein ASPZODRAFT_65538 [Penicilliopsis zonata CBS 506.65]